MSRFKKLSHTLWHCQYHIWSRGYCVDTVGLDADKICRYVKYQEAKKRQSESKQQRLF